MSYFHLGSDSEQLMHEQDKQEAYDQLRKRASDLGFACVNEALDELEKLREPNWIDNLHETPLHPATVAALHAHRFNLEETAANISRITGVEEVIRVKKSDA